MERRKSKKADLEKKRTLFFQIGLIISLSLVLAAFEWSTQLSGNNENYHVNGIELETELIPITRNKDMKPPEPKHYEKFVMVVDEEPIKSDFEPVDVEGFEDDKIIFQLIKDEDETPEPDSIYFIPEKNANPPGGMIGLRHYLTKNIRYPRLAAESDIQGKVYVRFVVNKKGKIENVHILRSVHPLLDNEALRVVKSMPDWTPGEQAGKPVSVWFTLPVVFALQ